MEQVPFAAEQDAVFVGANKQSFVVDYDYSHDLVAYGAGKTIALWKPTQNHHKGVFCTLKNHTAEVTCVRFVPNSPFLVSCAEDCKVSIWQRRDNSNHYELSQTMTEHTGSVTCITVLNEKIFATGGSDGHVILWGLDSSGSWDQITHFEVKSGFYPLTLSLLEVKQNQYILAIGGTTAHLYVYTFTFHNKVIDNLVQSAILTGHEDWIKCLAFTQESEDEFLLASGSQDRYIRLWRLRVNEKIDNSDEDSTKLILLSNKQYKFAVEHTKCAISFEALIMGHDDWVTGLSWHPSYDLSAPKYQESNKKLQLLSSSADTALMVWEMDHDSGIWICISRLGELSIKGASTATGASGGFWSCTWFVNNGAQYILTNGKTGSLRAYKNEDGDNNNWESELSITGPTKEVTDLVWSLNGQYFMATSLDQTTRLLAPWKLEDGSTWLEFARPQIHGYDMVCIDNISPTKFVSAGDEKILRVFEMTHSINRLLKQFCGIDIGTHEELPDTAALPVLGLSNKAANEQLEVGEASEQQDSEEAGDVKKDDILDDLTGPPLEDYLQRFTLFPEVEKLYGHGYEVSCCVTSPNGKLIASSCKSNSLKHGMLRMFNINNDFQQCEQTLPGHSLTITNIQFSPDGSYLLSVSRDRQFILWRVVDENTGQFEMVETNPKAHTRIIWDSSWLPKQLGSYFITVGRDKSLKFWYVDESSEKKVSLVDSLKASGVITSVSVHPEAIDNKAVVAIGLESGEIHLYYIEFGKSEKKLQTWAQIPQKIAPADKVSKLSFSKVLHDGKLLLASGSADTSIRLYSISIPI
ncbi:Elongator subunit elp2 [Yamadazyma tenuis]|uniref:Elongator complex protein 2 n=1 Tax=Candida tenuis (strain ATCC 10573 / BCRC 21748 / CBS 615 / JCM 9827 / NBRC 10315 / NRRL Y-1498 / VKM Y-70) TaxID=590646 RepID=G3B0I2_CANTC|nr:WD40 repeat-like protein [Yamadazyma tenuis ATCC 10573]EGV65407.1 WD40 repeat-like protein [Yamadazyma tenuis ATCC 10573]WEJ94922.1 Elongator subunit elp2 [Yamadazyma tenuis]